MKQLTYFSLGLLFLFLSSNALVWAQSKGHYFRNMKTVPNVIENGVQGISVKGEVVLLKNGKTLRDSLKSEHSITIDLELSVSLWEQARTQRTALGRFNLTEILQDAQNKVSFSYFIPYASLPICYGSQILITDAVASFDKGILCYYNGEKITSKVPEKAFYDLELVSMEAFGSNWDISGVGFSFKRGGIHSKPEDQAPDAFINASLGSTHLDGTGQFKNTSSLSNVMIFEQKAVCIGDLIQVSAYDEDTFFHDEIASTSIKADTETEKVQYHKGTKGSLKLKLKFKGRQRVEFFIKKIAEKPDEEFVTVEFTHKSAGYTQFKYNLLQGKTGKLIKELVFEMKQSSQLEEQRRTLNLSYEELGAEAGQKPQHLVAVPETAIAPAFSIGFSENAPLGVVCNLLPLSDAEKWTFINHKTDWYVAYQFKYSIQNWRDETLTLYAEAKSNDNLLSLFKLEDDKMLPLAGSALPKDGTSVTLYVRMSEAMQERNISALDLSLKILKTSSKHLNAKEIKQWAERLAAPIPDHKKTNLRFETATELSKKLATTTPLLTWELTTEKGRTIAMETFYHYAVPKPIKANLIKTARYLLILKNQQNIIFAKWEIHIQNEAFVIVNTFRDKKALKKLPQLTAE